MRRLVALTAVRQRNIPLILRAAADWAPYEHAKLAPLVVELPQETEDDHERRLHGLCVRCARRLAMSHKSGRRTVSL